MLRFIPLKWKLTARVIPFVALVVAAKSAAHYFGVEALSLSPLFGAVISANVFLIGFLISGVLSDYKESERLPGELACAFEVLADECAALKAANKGAAADALLEHVRGLIAATLSWFHKDERTGDLMNKISALNPHFVALEPLTQANFIVRLKQEQSIIRRLVTRIHTIRETDFNPSAYAIAEIISTLLTVGLVFTKISPYYESMFFISFVSFVQVYMVLLINELDNPFGYYATRNLSENVSLKPLFDLQRRIGTGEAPAQTATPQNASTHAPQAPASHPSGKKRRR